MGIQDREHLAVSSAAELVAWLEQNHATSLGLWVVTHKKSANHPAPTYDEIVRAVLCFGWVDSVPGKVDDERTKLYVSPRKSTSAWSQTNKKRVAELIASGEMRPSGMAAIDVAKANGAWSLIDGAQEAEIPDDLAAEFLNHPGSRDNFDAFPRGVRKQILEWIAVAKTDATRSKRIVETASLAAQNVRANQWRAN